MEWTAQEAERCITEIKTRSITDPEFRALALKDGYAAIAKVNSTPLPTGYKVKFVDNAGANQTIVLPDPVSNVEELSDAELEHVAGGANRNNVNV